ncbi:MAG: WD40/YVTN/BNR-like repeat-containing protein [bacterium]
MFLNKTIIFLIVVFGIISADTETQKFIFDNPSINDVCRIPETYKYVLVSDSGWVYFCDRYNQSEAESIRITTDYILTGVCFADTAIGYVVGYKRDEPNKDKGAIWKTINKGVSWIRLPQIPSFPLPTPFLDVEAVNRYVVWVTCGNDYVLRTIDGGINWRISRKKY